jgi:hypothetical protein
VEQRRKQKRAKAIEFEGKNDFHIKFSIAASVIPTACCVDSIPHERTSFPHVFSGNPGEIPTGPPIKTFGGDSFWKNSLNVF